MKKRVIVLGVLFLLAFLFILILVNVSAKTPELTFVQITDIHVIYNSSSYPYLADGRTDNCGYLTDLENYETYCSQGWSIAPQLALNSSVDLINSNYSSANFTIVTGDLIAQEAYSFNKIEAVNIFKSIIDRLQTDFYFLMSGRHDLGIQASDKLNNEALYESTLSQSIDYNFTIGDNLFIIISEYMATRTYNTTFLNNTINSYNNGSYKLFIFGHELPVEGLRTNEQTDVTSILEANKNNFKSISFFGGHNHANRHYLKEGISYFTTIPVMSSEGRGRLISIYDDHIKLSFTPVFDEEISNLSKAYKEATFDPAGIYSFNDSWQFFTQDVKNTAYQYSTGLGDEVYYIPTRFIDSCQSLTEFEGYYALNQSIDASGVATCINIQNDSITLDLNGYSIDGDTSISEKLIYSLDNSNIVIKNGNLTGGKGTANYLTLGVEGGENNTIKDLNLENINKLVIKTQNNFYLENVYINGSRSTAPGGGSIIFQDSDNSTLKGLTVNNSASRGIYLLFNLEGEQNNLTFRDLIIENELNSILATTNKPSYYHHLNFINATYNRSTVSMNNFNVTMNNVFIPTVNTSSDTLENINLTIINGSGNIVSSQLSDYRGFYDEIILPESTFEGYISREYTYLDNYSISLNDSNLVYGGLTDSINLTVEGGSIIKGYTLEVDATDPVVGLVSPLNDSSTNETSIDFIFNVTDANSNVDSCFVNFNGTLYYNTSAIVYSGNNTINVSNLSLGSYEWYAYCNDTVGNEANSSNKSFTIVSDEDYCTDVDSGFYYSSQCYADQTAACAASGQVVSGNGCADASSSSAPSNNLGTEGDYTGKTNKITYGVRHNFEYSSESHHTYLRKINRGTREVTIEVNSEKQLITIKEGENVSVDLTGDGVADVVFVLEKIYDDSIAIDLRVEEIVADEVVDGDVVVVVDDVVDEVVVVDSVNENNKFWIGFVVFLAIILVIIGWYVFKKNKNR